MCQYLEPSVPTSDRSSRPCLTEENLRVHSAVYKKASQQALKREFQYHDDTIDCDESEDGDLVAMHDTALRKAASLEALQAYGGCFVSGFLAMQEPLPWISSPTATTFSRSSSTSTGTGSPRPDSDTLSRADIRELSDRPKSNWRSMRKLRGIARRSKN